MPGYELQFSNVSKHRSYTRRLENFIFENKEEHSPLKLIDFGLRLAKASQNITPAVLVCDPIVNAITTDKAKSLCFQFLRERDEHTARFAHAWWPEDRAALSLKYVG